jgi:hypothetical protein
MEEYILCAAIWYKELPTSALLPINIKEGIVVCGHRHGHCINIMSSLAKLRSVTFGENSVGENTQGFLTNLNRFVDRREAAQIAYDAWQIREKTTKLFSEDLY